MTHRDIARLLQDKGYIQNGWWCQSVTVAYEGYSGRRVPGQAASAGFEVGAQKTLPISAEQAWALLTSPAGLRLWLGTLASLDLRKGQPYQAQEGTRGEVRSVASGHLRLFWQPAHRQQPTTLQVSILPSGTHASIRFHQEKLASTEEREQMRAHWQQVLAQLQAAIAGRVGEQGAMPSIRTGIRKDEDAAR